jgi:hypothetical protein
MKTTFLEVETRILFHFTEHARGLVSGIVNLFFQDTITFALRKNFALQKNKNRRNYGRCSNKWPLKHKQTIIVVMLCDWLTRTANATASNVAEFANYATAYFPLWFDTCVASE